MWNTTYGDSVKSVRSTLCKEADNLVNSAQDKGLDTTAFRQYRQALRDIPQTFSDPEAVTWPVKPSLPQASV